MTGIDISQKEVKVALWAISDCIFKGLQSRVSKFRVILRKKCNVYVNLSICTTNFQLKNHLARAEFLILEITLWHNFNYFEKCLPLMMKANEC